MGHMKKIKLNRSIYSDKAINSALTAYNNLAMFTVNFNREYAAVTFIKCKYDEAQTVKEFENYLIGAENS